MSKAKPTKALKARVREEVWRLLEARGAARPPYPLRGRIPNFVGAEEAARRLAATREWEKAEVVKVNPDSPQMPVRLMALREGKLLLMPTPRISRGFLLLDPSRISPSLYARASTIRGAFRYGVPLDTVDKLLRHIDRVDFIVEGSVAVNRWGERLGKGEGYGELEYAILLELGVIKKDVPIATTVHDLQVVNGRLPQDPYDVPIDIIATPTRLIRVTERPPRPKGLLWDLLDNEKLEKIPLLKQLKERLKES